MGWTTPVDRSTGYVVTATDWNATGQDDLAFLFGDTTWTNISAFSNSWAAGTVQPRYRLAGGTLVTLQGYIQSGTLNLTAFTLPSGYRPTENLTFSTVANGAAAGFTITTAGNFTPQFGSTSVFSISCTFSNQ